MCVSPKCFLKQHSSKHYVMNSAEVLQKSQGKQQAKTMGFRLSDQVGWLFFCSWLVVWRNNLTDFIRYTHLEPIKWASVGVLSFILHLTCLPFLCMMLLPIKLPIINANDRYCYSSQIFCSSLDFLLKVSATTVEWRKKKWEKETSS